MNLLLLSVMGGAWVLPNVVSSFVLKTTPTTARMSLPQVPLVATSLPHSSRSETKLYMNTDHMEVASDTEILGALANDATIIMDVRSQDEILQTGYLKHQSHKWVHLQCTPTEAPLLERVAPNLLPDPTVPVLIYCGSGKRAAKAQQVLKAMGYTTVLNAGGWSNVVQYVL